MRNRYFAHIVEKQGALCDHLDFTSTFFILLLRLGFTITFICWSNLSSNILVIERLSKTIKNYAYKGQYFRDQFFVPKFAEQFKQCKTNDLAWLCMAFRNQILMYKNLSPWTLRCAELACVCVFLWFSECSLLVIQIKSQQERVESLSEIGDLINFDLWKRGL